VKPIKPLMFENDTLVLLDQRFLPLQKKYFDCHTHQDVSYAIREMVSRGAPLIGAVAAYGVALACREFMVQVRTRTTFDTEGFLNHMKRAMNTLKGSRPTAVNLTWALKRMNRVLENLLEEQVGLEELYLNLVDEAHQVCAEDLETNYQIARNGVKVIKHEARILTHCNTGALATTGYGTALGVVREANYVGKQIFVYANETRPRLQGSRLTAWELSEEGIPFKLIPDTVSAVLMREKLVDVILVGADRIATNGDVANKIGTYMLSVLAKEHGIPFYSVAPISTIDFEIDRGDAIEIEERNPEEITEIDGCQVAPEGIDVYNPAFDVTPAKNITGIITEKGIVSPNRDNIMDLLSK